MLHFNLMRAERKLKVLLNQFDFHVTEMSWFCIKYVGSQSLFSVLLLLILVSSLQNNVLYEYVNICLQMKGLRNNSFILFMPFKIKYRIYFCQKHKFIVHVLSTLLFLFLLLSYLIYYYFFCYGYSDDHY